MDAVTRRADDLGHIRPHSIPPFATKSPAKTGAFDGHFSRLCLVCHGIDELRREVRIAQELPIGVVGDPDEFRIFGHTAQATHAELRSWCEAPDWSREHAVEARPADNDLSVQTGMKDFPQEQLGKPNPSHPDAEAARVGSDL